MARSARLRPARFDDLGLRRAMSDRLLPALVAAMTFLAALALAGAMAAAGMAQHWRTGLATVLTVQVPQPLDAAGDASRIDRVLATLKEAPGVGSVHVLSADELSALLRTWLGSTAQAAALPLPGVIEVHLEPGMPQADLRLQARLDKAAPGTFVAAQGPWIERLGLLARSLQACAGAALLLVAGVAAAVVAMATRAGLALRRDAIEIAHGLGATDGFISRRFAARATRLAFLGALAGVGAVVPVLLTLAALSEPFTQDAPDAVPNLPAPLWASLAVLPAMIAVIGWATAQATVRRWLRALP